MQERDKLIQKLIEEKGGSYDDYLNLLNAVGYHESAHTLDPTIKQIGGGPGRGKYQFEEGKNAGGITAAKRTVQYYKENNIPVPQWLKEATTSDSLDATKLSSEQQDILFLGNMRKHPKANFKNIWDGKETVSDFWANYHWAGDPKDRNKRLESFNRSLESLKKNPYTEIIPKENKENKEYNLTFNDSTPIRERVKENTLVAQKEYKLPELNSTITNVNKTGNLDNIMAYMNQKAMGGYVNDSIDKTLNSFNTGGLHEQNPLGGIPQGTGSNGKLNTVEENETSFQLTDLGKYIFSNRIKI